MTNAPRRCPLRRRTCTWICPGRMPLPRPCRCVGGVEGAWPRVWRRLAGNSGRLLMHRAQRCCMDPSLGATCRALLERECSGRPTGAWRAVRHSFALPPPPAPTGPTLLPNPSPRHLQLLLKLAEAAGVKDKIAAMYAGKHINTTENRAVLHVALRAPRDAVFEDDGKNVVPEVWAVLDQIQAFSGEPAGGWRGCWSGKLLLLWRAWGPPRMHGCRLSRNRLG